MVNMTEITTRPETREARYDGKDTGVFIKRVDRLKLETAEKHL